MSQSEKSAVYQVLKAAGVDFDRHYREYSLEELKLAHEQMVEAGQVPPLTFTEPEREQPTLADRGIRLPPVKAKDPDEMPAVRQNTQSEDEPIRIDPETGFIWYQEEVLKASTPKPRGRRVQKYNDPGVRDEVTKLQDGTTETFEVAGNESRVSEVKITLPSFQVGIYKDPRHPFRTHVYNGVRGFDLFEVEHFYGGADMVPEDVKRMYVANELCYDTRTVVRNIETQYRQLQLQGKV